MNVRTALGLAFAAMGIVGPALAIGLTFGFDEMVSKGDTRDSAALIIALLAGFACGLTSVALNRKQHGSSLPQLEVLRALMPVLDNSRRRRGKMAA